MLAIPITYRLSQQHENSSLSSTRNPCNVTLDARHSTLQPRKAPLSSVRSNITNFDRKIITRLRKNDRRITNSVDIFHIQLLTISKVNVDQWTIWRTSYLRHIADRCHTEVGWLTSLRMAWLQRHLKNVVMQSILFITMGKTLPACGNIFAFGSIPLVETGTPAPTLRNGDDNNIL